MPEPRSIENQIEFLGRKLESQIKKFGRKTRSMKYWTYALKFGGFGISFLITVLAGLNGVGSEHETCIKNAILALGAGSTLLASIAAFWNVQRYWLENILITDKLRVLQKHFGYLKLRAEPLGQEELDELWSNFEAIMMLKTQYWSSVLESAPSAQGK